MAIDFVTLRARHIPALWPIVIYWSGKVGKAVSGADGVGVIANVWRNGDYNAYWEASGMQRIAQHGVADLLALDDVALAKLRAKGVTAGDDILTVTKSFSNHASTASLSEYVAFLQAFEPAYQELITANMRYWLFAGEEIAKLAQREIAHLDAAAQREVMNIMTMPHEVTYSQRAESAFDAIVARARTEGVANVAPQIAEFAERYIWLPYEYVGPNVWDVAAVTKRVEETLVKPVVDAHTFDVATQQIDIIAKHQLGEEAQRLFAILQVLALMQDDRKMYNAHICYVLNGIIFTELAKKLGISVEEARYIDLPLLERIANGDTAFPAVLRSRLELFVALQDAAGDVHYFEGTAAEEELRKLGIAEEKINGATEVKGRTANPGVVRGTVRVFKTSSDTTEFNEGDILVTGMTTPDFVVLMKKAGAIITNEGGITCHAAIVSRELGKPCIIATGNATKVLRSGDTVEVDATNGIARILR